MKKNLIILNLVLFAIFLAGIFVVRQIRLDFKVDLIVEAAFPKDTELLVSFLYDSGINNVFDKGYNEKKSQGAVEHIIGDNKFHKYVFHLSEILPKGESLTGLWIQWEKGKIDGIIRFRSFKLKGLLAKYSFDGDNFLDYFNTWRAQMIAVRGIVYFKPTEGGNWLRWKNWWMRPQQEKMKRIYEQVKNGYKKKLFYAYFFIGIILILLINFGYFAKYGRH